MRSLAACLLALVITVPAAPICAQHAPNKARLLNRYAGNERGLTLNFIVDEKMWEWARSPSKQTLGRIDDQVHRAPQKGIQIEILTPGDFGLTLHYRW